MFCENLEKGIMPYLPVLMEHLLAVLKSSPSLKIKQLSISAIGATASAAKEAMKPYFQEIIEHFKAYLTSGEDENMRKLQIQTIDTLGILARNIGADTFLPLAKECVQLGLKLIEVIDDPDLRRCVYGLLAAISCLLKSEMGQYLPTIVNLLMMSLKSMEGVKTHIKEEAELVDIFNEEEFEEEIDLEDSDNEEEKIDGISVENAFLDEKEDACCALGELATNTGAPFLPYLEQCYQQVLELVDYPAAGVKKGAIAAIGHFCCCVYDVNKISPSPETQTALNSMLPAVLPKLIEVIKEDTDRTVVMAGVDTIFEMLEKIGEPLILITGAKDAILSCMKEIFTHKVACQDQDDEEDEQEAEYDGMLIESAGDVLPAMAKIMGGQDFLPFFGSFLTDLLKRLKQTSSVAEKSFSVGTLADIVHSCDAVALTFVDTLFPLFMKFATDEDDEVCSNAVFGIGALVENTGDKLLLHYPEILKTLFELLKHQEEPRLIDNVCAATCRLIFKNKAAVPLEQVLPIIMQCLPLKEDFEENPTVFACLIQLYGNEEPLIMQYVPQLINVVAHVLGTEQVKDDTQIMLKEFVRSVHEQCPQEFQILRSSLSEELAQKLDTCFTLTNGIS